MSELLFPYSSQREYQDDLVKAALSVCEKKKHLLVHAPTGLGKTAAALAPALTVALKEDLTVFFLTARHTQHMLALQTLHDIEKKHNARIPVLDLIGKKWLCLQPGAERLYSNEFMEFCRALREDQRCEFYENLRSRGETSQRALGAVKQLAESDGSTKSIMDAGKSHLVCPYEVAILHGRDARLGHHVCVCAVTVPIRRPRPAGDRHASVAHDSASRVGGADLFHLELGGPRWADRADRRLCGA